MIHFPRYLGSENIPAVTELCHSILNNDDQNIECDASELSFIDPFGLCLLAAVCHGVSSLGKGITINNLSRGLRSYCSRMDVFENCNIDLSVDMVRNDRSGSLVEVKRLENENDINQVSSSIAEALVGNMADVDSNGLPDEMTGYTPSELLTVPIQYMFSELLQNALTHGRRAGYHNACVWVAAQYYPSKNIVRLAVVDNGCGYLNTLGTHPSLVSLNHEGAIRTALMPETSCNNDVNLMGESINQGIGLTVVHDLTLRAEGRVSILTGDSALEFRAIGGNIAENTVVNTDWQGAALYLEVNRDALKFLNIHDVIREYLADDEVVGIRFED